MEVGGGPESWENEDLSRSQLRRGPREALRLPRGGGATRPGIPRAAPRPCPSKTSTRCPPGTRRSSGPRLTGNPAVLPSCFQPSLASRKGKGAFS